WLGNEIRRDRPEHARLRQRRAVAGPAHGSRLPRGQQGCRADHGSAAGLPVTPGGFGRPHLASCNGGKVDLYLQLALSGLFIGGIYALISVGLTLVFGVLRVVNFAHGEYLTMAMFITFYLHNMLALDPFLAS